MTTALNDPFILSQLQPKEYYRKWTEASYPIRPDGRRVDEFRSLNITSMPISTADSSATVTLGNTTVVVGIKYEVAEPSPGHLDGHIVPNVTLCAGASPQVRAGPPTDRAQLLSNHVAALLSRMIDRSSLMIEVGRLSWVLHVDAMVLNDAGNVYSGVWLGIVAALKLLHLPKVRIDVDTNMVYYDQNTTKKLTWRSTPLPLMLLFLPEHESLIVDPTDIEEMVLSPSQLTSLINIDDQSLIFYESISIPSPVMTCLLQNEGVQRYLSTMKSLISGLN